MIHVLLYWNHCWIDNNIICTIIVYSQETHTQSAKQWLEMLEDKSVPVLICLTYADKLYAELMGKDGSHPDVSHIQQRVSEECSVEFLTV